MSRKIFVLVLFGSVIVSCNQIKLESDWADQEITLDGKLEEWQENLVVPRNSRIGIGLMNDRNYLYLTLTTMDRSSIMQILSQRFTVWIDPKGGKNRHFGFTYPIGDGLRQIMQDHKQNPRDFDFFIHHLLSGQNEIEVISPGKDQIDRLGISNPAGLDVKVIYEKDVLTYEMRVPIKSSVENVYGVDIKPGKKIGVGLTTHRIDQSAMRNKMGSRPGGGMGRGGGLSSGGMGGRGGGMSRNILKEIDIWMEVSLAIEPD
jgi:hypothetical protein